MHVIAQFSANIVAAFLIGLAFVAAPASAAPKAERVVVEGYAGEAMEPFLSRDGRYLFFNTRNDPGANTNLHFAEAVDGAFIYRGILYGTISYDLDAVATMSSANRFCFVSPRDYRRTRVSVLCGDFDGKQVNSTTPQQNLATERMGRLIFDVELAADGQTMVYAEGTFSGDAAPDEADLYEAKLGPRGFATEPGSNTFVAINTGDLEYAPALSADGLELYFTRVTGIWPFRSPKIFRATRGTVEQPFGKPAKVEAIEGFVEGPSLAADGTIYFHKKVGGRFEIWRLRR
jgi:WD40-like Beta Propeller Repeat